MDYSILIAGAQTREKTAWKSADQRFFRREFTEDSAAFPYYMSAEGDAAAQRMKVKEFPLLTLRENVTYCENVHK